MHCGIAVAVDKDEDDISQKLNELQLQLSTFQSEFATKYVLRHVLIAVNDGDD